jgi:hypothetical protein
MLFEPDLANLDAFPTVLLTTGPFLTVAAHAPFQEERVQENSCACQPSNWMNIQGQLT